MKDEAVKYRVKGRVVLRRIGEDRLLVPVSGDAARENCVFPLNSTGVFIWEQLSAGQLLDEVARRLADSYEVTIEQSQADCRDYAGALVAQQLLEEGAS